MTSGLLPTAQGAELGLCSVPSLASADDGVLLGSCGWMCAIGAIQSNDPYNRALRAWRSRIR